MEVEEPDPALASIEPSSLARLLDGLRAGDESCGTWLWDLAASPGAAHLMLEHGVLELVEQLLPGIVEAQQGRPAELCLGVTANLVAHAEGAARLAAAPGLAAAVLGGVLMQLHDPGALAECCRLLAAACQLQAADSAWRQLLAQPPALARLVWIADNTLDPALLQRCWELLGALVQAEPAAAPALLGAGALGPLQAALAGAAQRYAPDTPQGSSGGHVARGGAAGGAAGGWSDDDDAGAGASSEPEPAAPSQACSQEATAAALACLEQLGSACAAGVLAHMSAPQGQPLLDAPLALLACEVSAILEPLLLVLVVLRRATLPRLAADVRQLRRVAEALAECDPQNEDALDAGWYLLSAALQHVQQTVAQHGPEPLLGAGGDVFERTAAVLRHAPVGESCAGYADAASKLLGGLAGAALAACGEDSQAAAWVRTQAAAEQLRARLVE